MHTAQADVAFDAPDFYELFNATADEWLMRNVYGDADQQRRDELSARVHEWLGCVGDECM